MPRGVWLVIVCGGAVLGLAAGLRQAFGLYLAPISLDLGVGRGSFAFAMGLMNLIWGLGAPIAGAIADRWGAGRVAAAGGALYAGGLAWMAASDGAGDLIGAGVLIGLGLSAAGFSVTLGAVARAAPAERRAYALAIASVGGSLGQFLAVPYTHVLIETWGWAVSLLALAATAALMVPLAGGLALARPQADAGRQTLRQALGEALGHRGFLLLTAGFFVCGFQLAFVSVHLPAYLADRGFAPSLGANALALIGLCNILGAWLCGVAGARFLKKNALAVIYLLRGLIFLGFIVAPLSEASVLIFAGALGFLWLGTVPLTSGLVAVLFGPVYMSTLYGVVFLSHQLGGFLGAAAAGWAYDAAGSYDAMWQVSAALGFLAAALHWPIRERPVARLAAA